MRLILVRHGITNWNEVEKCQGISDIPLNQNGIAQAEKLAYSLRNEKLDVIYSSNLQRAYLTAKKIADYHSLEVKIDNRFREMNQGQFEGLNFSYIREKYPNILKKWRECPETLTIPGGESLLAVQNRAYEAILKLKKKYNSKNVLIVSHNLTIIALLCKFSGKSLSNFRDYMVDECSKSLVEYANENFFIKSVNNTTHL